MPDEAVSAADVTASPDADSGAPTGGGGVPTTGQATGHGFGNALDALVDRAWEPLRGQPWADRLFYSASNAAEFSLLWHALGGLRALHPRRRAGDAVAFSAVVAAESLLVNQGVKRLFERVRPGAASDNRSRHQLRQPVTSSFPSGHASAAFCAAAMLSKGSKLAPLYRAAATAVALSRVHVRLHHASDVVAGAAVGEVLGRLARSLLR